MKLWIRISWVWLSTLLALTTLAQPAVAGYTPTPPTLDGKIDDVYKQYGTVTRYSNNATHEATGEANKVAAYMYVLEDADYIYVYYHQDQYYENDTSYGENSVHWESREKNNRPGKRNFYDIWESDRGEFSFVDAGGNVAGYFYVDQISPANGTPSGYDCLGFTGGDGAWLGGSTANQAYFEISSSMDYNLNHTGYCVNGNCGCGGTNILDPNNPDENSNSPETVGNTYEFVPGSTCTDWVWYNGWEIKIDKAAFGTLGYGWTIGNHHNSPTKTCDKKNDCPADMYIATASIGDRVWFDLDADGTQDGGEPGIQGVTVNLIDTRDGSLIDSKVTGPNGGYLFEMLSNEYYIVQVDESTLPSAGFVNTTGNGIHPDYHTSYVNNVCGSDCLQADGATYSGVYYIDLDDGDTYHAADFGYNPDGATIGDYVWVDADQDGFQDPGEPAIGGVTLELLDDNDNVIATTTTTSSGRYFFFGLDAGDYKVKVGNSNYASGGALEGFTLVVGAQGNPSPTNTIQLNEDQQYISADFGFYKDGLGTIGDYVWYDADTDGVQDAGEDGAANVTLDLYVDSNGNGVIDSGEPFIAQAVTDADGYYLFVGLDPENVDYLVTVSDQYGVLDGFYITSYDFDLQRYNDPYPVNLTAAEPNDLTADFGYNRDYSIGDFVWLDANQNGIFDQGERGVSGVTVTLSGAASDTTTTGPNGYYLFPDLEPGTYSVSITVPDGYELSMDASTSTPWTPTPHTGITLSGRESYLKADFALYQDTYELGDKVWYDEDGNGVQDTGEVGAASVTLSLYLDMDGDGVLDPTEPEIARTTTDQNGDYLFSNLSNDDYIVVVTDNYGILQGYTLTTANEPHAYSVSGSNYYGADFGYLGPQPTVVVISRFTAHAENGAGLIEWQTASEVGTVGFYLYRKDQHGPYERVNASMLPALSNSPQGGIYRYKDMDAYAGQSYKYKVEEVDMWGKHHFYGPFNVTIGEAEISTPKSARSKEFDAMPHTGKIPGPGKATSAGLRSFSGSAGPVQMFSQKEKLTESSTRELRLPFWMLRAKLLVPEEGIYHVPADEIASALGIRVRRANRMIRSGMLSLSNRGKPVAYHPAEDGIIFYGQSFNSPFTDQNIYWLEWGRGVHMDIESMNANPGSGRETFIRTVKVEENMFPAPPAYTDPAADFWVWDYIQSTSPSDFRRTFAVQSPGLAPHGDGATLSVHLKGAMDTSVSPDHHVQIFVNGFYAGEDFIDGTAAATIVCRIPADQLKDGINTIEISGILDTGANYSMVYIESLELTYSSFYEASGNALGCTADGNRAITIGGFQDADIRMFDISDPDNPRLIITDAQPSSTGGYEVHFEPEYADAAYYAAGQSNIHTLSAVRTARSTLKMRYNHADYLIITPELFAEQAQRLSKHRSSKGHTAKVVYIEDIMNEFHDGLFSPFAIKDFLSYAYHNWLQAPQFVVLVGAGSFDYKNIWGYGDCLVPPLMVSTSYGLFALDQKYVDIVGNDGVPEMAIGRLPFTSARQIDYYIDKVIAFEAGGDWQKHALLVSDKPKRGETFIFDNEQIASQFPSDWQLDRVYLTDYTDAQANSAILSFINSGIAFFNYVGHSGSDRMSKGMLSTAHIPDMANTEAPFVTTAMTCVLGRFAIPGYDTFSEALLAKKDGGASAVWSGAGMSDPIQARIMGEQFYKAVFEGEPTLGDAIVKALSLSRDQGVEQYMLHINNLLGDPGLKLSDDPEEKWPPFFIKWPFLW